jgi:hypothetical protein
VDCGGILRHLRSVGGPHTPARTPGVAAWFEAAYTDPSTVDPTIFDKSVHPHASCWFKESAEHLLDRVPGYLALLDRYGISWVERRSRNPGTIIYEDADQVVVTPPELPHPDDDHPVH